jgi:hypothetical protein
VKRTPALEDGAASMNIALSKSAITIRHGDCGTILLQKTDVPKGAWGKLWRYLIAMPCAKQSGRALDV